MDKYKKKDPWEKKPPKNNKEDTLTPAAKKYAKDWAARNGVKYPSLVANMQATKYMKRKKGD
jgi:hypothetical protein